MKGKRGKIERKVRSDKKVDVKPTMSIALKEQLYHFAYLSNEPVKDAAERLCIKGAVSEHIITNIRQWFRRDYHRPNCITTGYLDRPRLKLITKGEVGKVTIKFPQESYDLLCRLAFSLDLTPTSTATVLIKVTLNNNDFMNEYISNYLGHLSNQRVKEIKSFLKL